MITPAMKKWCQYLRDGGTIKKYNVVSYHAFHHGFTYTMGMKLEKAGLVYTCGGELQLTESGMAACS